MTNNARTGWRAVIWPNKWYWKGLIILACIYVFFTLLLLTAHVEKAGAATAAETQLSAAVASETGDSGLTTWDTLVVETSVIPARCHGRVWRTYWMKTPALVPITLGWRRTAIDRWCSNGLGLINDWGTATGDDGKYTLFPYCFTNVTYGKVWWTKTGRKDEAKVWNQGTLAICGHISPAVTLNPRIYFHAATITRPYVYWNYGDGIIRH